MTRVYGHPAAARTPPGEGALFDVTAFLDSRRFGALHLLVIAACGLAMIVDSFGLYVPGFVLPAIARGFQVQPADLKVVLTWQQVGAAAGALLAGPISDKIGRKIVLVTCVAAVGTLNVVAALASSLTELSVLRFLCAVFVSGVLPAGIVLATELAPTRLRATLATIVYGGFAAGAAVGTWLGPALEVQYGWQGAFWAAGLMALALVPLLVLVPESLYFRVHRNPRDGAIARTLGRLDRNVDLAGIEAFRVHEPKSQGGVPI